MPNPLVISLDAQQRAELVAARDHHAKPYVRERAAAVLKVADGGSCRQVARTGLLRSHKPHTIAAWIRRFQAGGVSALLIAPGRGRKPLFSPPQS